MAGQQQQEQELPFAKVVVIGAGLSGLYAAREIRRHHDDVVVVEASHHIGGRVRQVEGIGPAPVDIGPEFIHGAENSLLMDVVKEMGGEVEEYEWPDRYYLGKEHRMIRGDVAHKDIDYVHELFEDVKNEAIEEDLPADEWLRRRGASDLGIELADACYANDFGCGLKDMGLHQLKDENRAWNHGESYLVLSTPLSAVTRHLSRGLAVRTGWVVREIRYGGPCGNVLLVSDRGEKLQCAKCILTVPLTVLKARGIAFVPPLPPAKLDAIDRIGIGNACKVVMAFSRPFWPEGLFDVVCTHCFLPEVWMTDYAHPTAKSRAVVKVTGFACGERCARVLALTEGEAMERSLAQLDAMFGSAADPTPARDAFVTGRVLDWSKEEFIGGAYTHPTLGARGCQARLAAPLGGRLFFGGEATHVGVNPCMQGAMETGRRAAAEVLAALQGGGGAFPARSKL